MRRIVPLIALLASGLVVAGSGLPRSPAPESAKLYFISPKDGETLSGPVTVRFGLSGMGVAPAGTVAEHTGHHHLVIDAPLPAADQPIPNDAKHLHFGKGQTEAVVTLAPGKHTLQLLLGDHSHIPHDPPVVSERITITVE
ncbi:MAG TPA: DUF4399 domain-containing protein [Arenimonas sp.]|nr:DUF4399 domain-containing protein [Arenimonas sp.]